MNVSVTFDNLGEASDLERGWWPEDEPLGAHYSVTEALPRVLEALDETGLRATFFVEGLNTELYPDTLRELDARGHEVACHGWRHERWSGLSVADERASLELQRARPAGEPVPPQVVDFLHDPEVLLAALARREVPPELPERVCRLIGVKTEGGVEWGFL